MKQRFKSILALGIAASGLLIASPEAFAGNKELQAFLAALSPATPATATGDQVATAVTNAISANSKLKPGVIAGEALKIVDATDAGTKVGIAIAGNAALAAKLSQIAADAAVTASTGSAPDPSLVPDFAQEIVNTDTDAFKIAGLAVKKSKTAAGAVIGGRAQETTGGDAALLTLANSSIQGANKKLASAAQSIAQYVGDVVSSAGLVDFATSFAGSNLKSLTLIAPGAVAADPLQASAILDGLYSNGITQSATLKATTKLAKSLSLVADSEEVQKVGVEIGERIATGAVKITSVNAVAKSLVQGLAKHAVVDDTSDARSNRLDEVGEVAAYLLNAVSSSVEFDKLAKGKAKAVNIITGLIKNIIAGAKLKTDAAFQTEIIADVAGSIGLTLNSLGTTQFDANIAGQISAALTNPKTAKKILGSKLAKTQGAAFTAAITEGINNSGAASTKYEDGTQPDLGTINEPVTDNRNG